MQFDNYIDNYTDNQNTIKTYDIGKFRTIIEKLTEIRRGINNKNSYHFAVFFKGEIEWFEKGGYGDQLRTMWGKIYPFVVGSR